MGTSRDVARAAVCLGVLLTALALPRIPSARLVCTPREIAASGGRTTGVSCCGGPADAAGIQGPARLLFRLPIDPNAADAGTLELLPGIGPARAAALVRARGERPFRSLDDLDRVSGIGARRRALLAPWIGFPSEDSRPNTPQNGLHSCGAR